MILKELDTDNKKLIDDYVKNNPDAKLQGRSRLESLNGQTKIIQGYRLPTKLIFYNINNGRFKKEYINLVRKYGGNLDSRKPEDAKKIQNLLLTLGEKDGKISADTQRTMNDIKKKGQLELGIITQDGFLIDGNRRMAVINKLFEENQESKYEYIDVAKLEQSIQDKDMWAMEAGIQLGLDPKVRYKPNNELLKLDEGIKLGYTELEIAQLLYGDISPEEIKRKIGRLGLIKKYLKSFFNDEDNIELAEGKHEHFIELQNIIDLIEDKTLVERMKIINAVWNLIHGGISSDRIRIIKSQINNGYNLDSLFEIGDIEKPNPPDEEEEEELKDEQTEVEIKFLNLEDEVRAQKNSDKPLILLTHILTNFKSLKIDDIDVNDPNSKKIISKILEKMEELQKKISE